MSFLSGVIQLVDCYRARRKHYATLGQPLGATLDSGEKATRLDAREQFWSEEMSRTSEIRHKACSFPIYMNPRSYQLSKFPNPPDFAFFFGGSGSSHSPTISSSSTGGAEAVLRYLPTPEGALSSTLPSPLMRLPVQVVLSSSVPP
ncbi:hypothetical protein KCU90_g134, partial [Aureobasidium melanogenum]